MFWPLSSMNADKNDCVNDTDHITADQSHSPGSGNNVHINCSPSPTIPEKNMDSESDFNDLTFTSKGLRVTNLNVRHLVTKVDEIQIMLANENGPDILGLCETFLDKTILDEQVSINGYESIRKDRCDTVDKASST